MKKSLEKPHYTITPGADPTGGEAWRNCLYCESSIYQKNKVWPSRHEASMIEEPGKALELRFVNCPGFIHCELQLKEAIPGVSAPEVMMQFACDRCDYERSEKFFDYVDQHKPFADLSEQELIGVAFGQLHIIQSHALMLVNFDGDPNLHTKKEGKGIQIHRAIAHAALQALSERLDRATEPPSLDLIAARKRDCKQMNRHPENVSCEICDPRRGVSEHPIDRKDPENEPVNNA